MDFIMRTTSLGHHYVSEYQLKFLMIRLNQIHETLLDRTIKKDFLEKSLKELSTQIIVSAPLTNVILTE
jgi:hypothetical protein